MITTPQTKSIEVESPTIIKRIRPEAEQRIVLHNISWQTFEQLLTESGDKRNNRFYYLNGTLEIMSPLALHERSNRFIDDLIRVLSDELDIELCKCGSLLMRIRDRKLGAEPDSCYYIKNEPLIREKTEIIMGQDPPPDLVLEVDITNPSDRRLPIYAMLGIAEVWIYDGYNIKFLALENGEYLSIEQSLSFPVLPTAIVVEFMQKRFSLGERKTLKEFRQWVGKQTQQEK
jgi:Uma2 family endonuclease